MTKTPKEIEMGLQLRGQAQAMTIVDQHAYNQAGLFLVDIKTKMKEVEAAMDPQCKAAYVAWQTALVQKKTYLKPYEEAETALKKAMGAYQLEQRRLAAEAEEKAMEEARKLEEKEKAKLLRKAGKAKTEEQAEELREQAENVFVPVIIPDHSVAKSEGITTTSDFSINIIDMKGFLTWLMETELDLSSVLSVKIAPIKQHVKLTKVKVIPGAWIAEKVIIAAKVR